LLVLTGVTDAAALLAAPATRRPTYVAWNLDGLNVTHPAVVRNSDNATCGGWRAKLVGAHVDVVDESVRRDGGLLDALRALAAVVWSAEGSPKGFRGDARVLEAFGLDV
jgi:glycerol 3-phosphatase-2